MKSSEASLETLLPPSSANHEGFIDVPESQAEEAVAEARWLQDWLVAWLADRHPEAAQA